MLSVQGAGHPAGFLLPLTFDPRRKMNLEAGQGAHSSKRSQHLQEMLTHTLLSYICEDSYTLAERRCVVTGSSAPQTQQNVHSNAPFHAGRTGLGFL